MGVLSYNLFAEHTQSSEFGPQHHTELSKVVLLVHGSRGHLPGHMTKVSFALKKIIYYLTIIALSKNRKFQVDI